MNNEEGGIINRRRSSRLMSKENLNKDITKELKKSAKKTSQQENKKKINTKKSTKNISNENKKNEQKSKVTSNLLKKVKEVNSVFLEKNNNGFEDSEEFKDSTSYDETSEEIEYSLSSIDSSDSECDYESSESSNYSNQINFKKKRTIIEDDNDENLKYIAPKKNSIARNKRATSSISVEKKKPRLEKSSSPVPVKMIMTSKGKKAKEVKPSTECLSKLPTSFLKDYLNKRNNIKQEKKLFTLNHDIDQKDNSLATKEKNSYESKSKFNKSSSESSGDENDWVEMDRIDDVVDANDDNKALQITIQRPKSGKEKEKEDEQALWEKEVRLEIARRRREMFENCHKCHVLCYIAHLQFYVNAVLKHQNELASLLSNILPSEILGFSLSSMEKTIQKFRSAFHFCNSIDNISNLSKNDTKINWGKLLKKMSNNQNAAIIFVSYLKYIIKYRCFTSSRELAVICFAFFHCVLKLSTRLCVSFDPMPRVEDVDYETLNGKKGAKRKSTVEIKPKIEKIEGESKKETEKVVDRRNSKRLSSLRLQKKNLDPVIESENENENEKDKILEKSSDEEEEEDNKKSKKGKVSKTAKTKKLDFKIDEKEMKALTPRNYWVEFFNEEDRRWISVDLTFAIVDCVNKIEQNASKPMLYVIAVDNEMGVRELSAKYSSEFLKLNFRRLRADKEWLEELLNKELFKANEIRSRAEDVEIRNYLLSLPKPSIVSEYKNHPLYALEKDFLKFEAIYPPETKPIGEIRGHKIYPRNCVYTLQGDLNWIRVARSVKKGEKPYKIVKARPKLSVPKEERVQLFLDVYGIWQTEQFVPPPVIDGKIPRNEHGNIYLYQECMVPKDCVYLRLNGLYNIARKLDLEAVQAVVGWEFSGGRNHPILEGCVVLEKDAETLKKAWKDFMSKKEEKEAKRAEERVWRNWKTLIKGKILLEKMRSRFK